MGFVPGGLRKGTFELPKAENLKDQNELIQKLQGADMGTARIVLTGKGRVGNGAREMLVGMKMREVTSEEFLKFYF